jgi:hypothetical protein
MDIDRIKQKLSGKAVTNSLILMIILVLLFYYFKIFFSAGAYFEGIFLKKGGNIS